MKSLSVVALSLFALTSLACLPTKAELSDSTAIPADVSLPEDSAEQKLLQAIAVMEKKDWVGASRQVDALVGAFPNFKLGGLLQKLIAEESPLPETRPSPVQPHEDEFLPSNLEAELTLRRESLSDKFNNNLFPAHILRLADKIRYVFVVGLEKSRFYVIENQNGSPRVIADYYAGIGKQGIGKQREGDHRTPVGVYTVTDYLSDQQLPELYGAGALPLDYPNAWDKRLDRTGSGIWLHGVPRDTYSRPPRSSRGCITLSNHVFEALQERSTPGNTIVITAPVIDWQEPGVQTFTDQEISDVLEQWRKDWSSLDFERYIANYSADFKTSRHDFQSWAERKRSIGSRKEFIEVNLEDISIFRYPGEENLIQINYRQHYNSNNFSNSTDKTQYWRKNSNGRWQIIYEGSYD